MTIYGMPRRASQEGKLGGREEGYGGQWGEAVIYHGVGTNCLLALLLWTFNNNKSHTTRHEMRPKQGAIFTFHLSDKKARMCFLRIPFVFLDFPSNVVHL